MYCKNCGEEISNQAVICPKCGCQLVELKTSNSNQVTVNDDGNIGWAFLGFFLPIVGLILFLAWSDTKPRCAKSAGKGALTALIVEIVGFVVAAIYGISILGAAIAYL